MTLNQFYLSINLIKPGSPTNKALRINLNAAHGVGMNFNAGLIGNSILDNLLVYRLNFDVGDKSPIVAS